MAPSRHIYIKRVVEAPRKGGSLTGKHITEAIRHMLGRGTPCSRVEERLYACAWCGPELDLG